MKKFLLAIGILLYVSVSGAARDNYARDEASIPSVAREIIKNNFKGKFSFAKIDKTMGKITEYEVVLTDGTEITFDSKGNWKEIEASVDKGVPSSMVPDKISEYVKAHHKGAKIVGIDKGRNGYEVELSTNIDIKFDNSGNFQRYD